MRSARVLLAICLAGVVGLALVAVTMRTRLAFTLGVTAGGVAAGLAPRHEACQTPVAIPDADAAFERVVVTLGTYGRPGPPVEITVAPVRGGAALAQGRLPGGYPDVDRSPRHAVEVGKVTTQAPVRVCVRNLGDHKVAVYGNGPLASRTSSATLDGRPLNSDLSLTFELDGSPSLASLVPAIFNRASLFRAGWVGAWTYVVLALAMLLGVPLLVAAALRAAARTGGGAS